MCLSTARCPHCLGYCRFTCKGAIAAQEARDAAIRQASLSLHTNAGTQHWRQERLLDRIEDGSL